MQWKGLTLGEPPSWSWLTPQPGKYAHETDRLVDRIQFHSNVFGTLTQHICIPQIMETVIDTVTIGLPQIFHHIQDKKMTNFEREIWFRTDLLAKLPKTFWASLQTPCQLLPSNTSGLVLWRIEFPLTDLTTQGTGNGWGCLIQRCLNVPFNDQLSKILAF